MRFDAYNLAWKKSTLYKNINNSDLDANVTCFRFAKVGQN